MPVPYARLLDKHGLNEKSLKAAFDQETIEKRPEVKALVTHIQDKIRNGIELNRRDYRLFKAMDWAYDQPFYQVAYTQLRGLMSGQPDDQKVMQKVQSWGLTHLFQDKLDSNGQPCCDSSGKRIKVINLPVFYNIFVPVVMAYCTIRWAKIYNDRNTFPHFKYEPIQHTKENRMRCEIVTQAVQRMSSWFDYPVDTKQTIIQTLVYGICINFPRESWFTERQENSEGVEKIVKEGLRFTMPHPSRTYYDQFHRASTLNSNSGCCHAGYWEVCRYSDVEKNEKYWNRNKIAFGKVTEWFDISGSDFFEQVYPCSLKWPTSDGAGSGGAGALDRETIAAGVYVTGTADSAMLRTNHFERIIPADHGLGTYKYPVWFRFVFASDSTVIYAEPLAFDRLPTYAYDADFNRARFRSMALEIVPFQDMIGQQLSQWVLAVQQNLVNPIFYDKDKLPPEYVKMMENMGQKMMNGNIYIPFSSTDQWKIGTTQQNVFHQPQFARHNTGEISALISGILSMLDRVMQLSPQEVGQAASHEQTAEESRIIARNTSTRVEFTETFFDEGDYAKKVMLYDAMMAHADDEIVAGISTAIADTEEEFNAILKKLGFKADEDSNSDKSASPVRLVRGKKEHLQMEAFASTRDKSDRIDNAGIADAMSKIFIAVGSNLPLIESIGTGQLIELLNQIIVAAGLPKEFKLRKIANPQTQQQSPEELSQMLNQMAEQIRAAIDQSQQQTLRAAAEQTTQIVGQAIGAVSEQMAPVVEAVAQSNQVNQVQQQEIQALGQAVQQLNAVLAAAASAPAMAAPSPAVAPVTPGPGIGVPL